MGTNYREYTTLKSAEKTYKIFNEIYRTGRPSDIIDYEMIRGDGSIAILELTTGLITR